MLGRGIFESNKPEEKHMMSPSIPICTTPENIPEPLLCEAPDDDITVHDEAAPASPAWSIAQDGFVMVEGRWPLCEGEGDAVRIDWAGVGTVAVGPVLQRVYQLLRGTAEDASDLGVAEIRDLQEEVLQEMMMSSLETTVSEIDVALIALREREVALLEAGVQASPDSRDLREELADAYLELGQTIADRYREGGTIEEIDHRAVQVFARAFQLHDEVGNARKRREALHQWVESLISVGDRAQVLAILEREGHSPLSPMEMSWIGIRRGTLLLEQREDEEGQIAALKGLLKGFPTGSPYEVELQALLVRRAEMLFERFQPVAGDALPRHLVYEIKEVLGSEAWRWFLEVNAGRSNPQFTMDTLRRAASEQKLWEVVRGDFITLISGWSPDGQGRASWEWFFDLYLALRRAEAQGERISVETCLMYLCATANPNVRKTAWTFSQLNEQLSARIQDTLDRTSQGDPRGIRLRERQAELKRFYGK